jgi:hypothetical protein
VHAGKSRATNGNQRTVYKHRLPCPIFLAQPLADALNEVQAGRAVELHNEIAIADAGADQSGVVPSASDERVDR